MAKRMQGAAMRMRSAGAVASILMVAVALLMAAAFVLVPGPAARAARRALVVGVDRYDNLPPDKQLKKAVNDARAVAAALKRLGFAVTAAENVDRSSFDQLWAQFSSSLSPDDVAALYFSGHGVELSGVNYLIPGDVPQLGEGAELLLRRRSISLNELLDDLRERHPRMSLLIIDACRNNPFTDKRGRSVGSARGLTRTDAPKAANFFSRDDGLSPVRCTTFTRTSDAVIKGFEAK